MTSPTLILLRLDVRHAADELRWAFWAAGTDLADERDAIDRIYQLYIVLIMMGAIASCWMFALDTARSAGAGLTGISASICMLALHLAPLVALALKADETLRGCPVHMTAADIAWLSRSIPKGLWVASSVTKNLVANAAVAACCGYLLGTFGESAIGTQAAIAVAAPMCLGTPIGAALGNAAGLARMTAPRRRRLAAVAILALGAAGCWGLGGLMEAILRANMLAPVTLPPQTGALCASACAMGIAPLVTAARAARMDRIIDANSLYADMHSLRHLRIAPGGGAPYRKLLRIRRLEARRFRSVINIGSGMLAPVSRAFISHVRQPMPLLSAALFWSVIIIPWYAVLATTAHHFMMNLVWLVLAVQGMESAREVTRVFTEDCRNRARRQHTRRLRGRLNPFDRRGRDSAHHHRAAPDVCGHDAFVSCYGDLRRPLVQTRREETRSGRRVHLPLRGGAARMRHRCDTGGCGDDYRPRLHALSSALLAIAFIRVSL